MLDLSYLLSRAENIFPLWPAKEKDKYVFAIKPHPTERKLYYDHAAASIDESTKRAFGLWEMGVENYDACKSCFFVGLNMGKVVKEDGLWIPGPSEVQEMLSSRVIRTGSGITVGLLLNDTTDEGNNISLARALYANLPKKERKLPLLIPFRSLDFRPNPYSEFGIDIFFRDGFKHLIKGKEAEEISLQYRDTEKAGINSISFGSVPNYFSISKNLDMNYFGSLCDWFCGEADRQELRKTIQSLKVREHVLGVERLSKSNLEEERLLLARLD